jgi:hypothetical protein
VVDRRRRRFEEGGAARRRGSAAGRGWRSQAVWPAVAAGAADLVVFPSLSSVTSFPLSGGVGCGFFPLSGGVGSGFFPLSDGSFRQLQCWLESPVGTGDRKIAPPVNSYIRLRHEHRWIFFDSQTAGSRCGMCCHGSRIWVVTKI